MGQKLANDEVKGPDGARPDKLATRQVGLEYRRGIWCGLSGLGGHHGRDSVEEEVGVGGRGNRRGREEELAAGQNYDAVVALRVEREQRGRVEVHGAENGRMDLDQHPEVVLRDGTWDGARDAVGALLRWRRLGG